MKGFNRLEIFQKKLISKIVCWDYWTHYYQYKPIMFTSKDFKDYLFVAVRWAFLYVSLYFLYWIIVQIYVETCAPRTFTGFIRAMFLSASPWCRGLVSFQSTLLVCLSTWFSGMFICLCTFISRIYSPQPVVVRQ